MPSKTIAQRVRLHNALQLFLGVGLIPVSFCLWWISFSFFRFAFFWPLQFVLDNASTIAFYVAWLCMIPLAIEGVRRTRSLFDLNDYVHSDFYDNFVMQSQSGRALSAYYGQPIAMAYLVTQVLFAAPQTMMVSIRSFRSLLPTDETIARDATRILRELRKSRKWTPAEEYKEYGAALMLLDKLDLIWTENKSGRIEIRYPAGEP